MGRRILLPLLLLRDLAVKVLLCVYAPAELEGRQKEKRE